LGFALAPLRIAVFIQNVVVFVLVVFIVFVIVDVFVVVDVASLFIQHRIH